MESKIILEVSNRHVHLNEETYNRLFKSPLNKIKDLSIPGEFVSDKVVTLKTDNYEIKNVKVLGPLREYNQVEISHNDALKFKLDPPVRASGDLDGAENITLISEDASTILPACIIAQRHVHMTPEDASKYGVSNGQKVGLKVSGDKSGIMDAYIKVSQKSVVVAHIDTDDANSFLVKNGDEGTLII